MQAVLISRRRTPWPLHDPVKAAEGHLDRRAAPSQGDNLSGHLDLRFFVPIWRVARPQVRSPRYGNEVEEMEEEEVLEIDEA